MVTEQELLKLADMLAAAVQNIGVPPHNTSGQLHDAITAAQFAADIYQGVREQTKGSTNQAEYSSTTNPETRVTPDHDPGRTD